MNNVTEDIYLKATTMMMNRIKDCERHITHLQKRNADLEDRYRQMYDMLEEFLGAKDD